MSISGKAAGGYATAKKLSPQQKKDRAKKGAATRWDLPKAKHGRDDRPLMIGAIEIPCFVLEDGRRVLLQKEMASAIGMSNPNASQLSEFCKGKMLEPYFKDKNIPIILNDPFKFRTMKGGIAYGYEATILTDICDAVLEARKEGRLLKSQEHIAMQCEILMRGFARVGIIALIDEATGYQSDRAKDALAKILEAYIAKELQPYVKTFPKEFYEEIFRLRGLPFQTANVKRPQYFGILTNNIVYERLGPGIKEELKKAIPKNDAGRPTAKLFQKLTSNKGYLKLREQLASVITLMKLSNKWNDFMNKLEIIHPKITTEQLTLDLQYYPEEDDGKGI
jgi:hypothetical protein